MPVVAIDTRRIAEDTAQSGPHFFRATFGRHLRTWFFVASVIVLALGAVEDVYGNTDTGDIYGSDAVQYLDNARAIGRHDWTSAFNPLWSQGYPALLAAARPMFAAGPGGDWATTRVVNFGIFAFDCLAFLYLASALIAGVTRRYEKKREGHSETAAQLGSVFLWGAALALFVATQVCLGQPSRVSPDELVSAFVFLAGGILACWLYGDGTRPLRFAAGLGVVLGLGFIVKAVFLVLGCSVLVVLAVALWLRHLKATRYNEPPRVMSTFVPLLLTIAIFAGFVGAEGAGLTHATGHFTLGEAGSINYAWHVNRLQKWVHWEGGNQTAEEAWPKPALARFAQWDTLPPDFGTPAHPSLMLQNSPLVYGFAAPMHATYVPYFDPPYWYAGYRHIVRVRYQMIALAKSAGDLIKVVFTQPIFYALLLVFAWLLWERGARRAFVEWAREHSSIVAVGVLGVLIYLPVHLEGRYLSSFLALVSMCLLVAATRVASVPRLRAAMVVMLIGVCGSVAVTQLPVWRNALHHKSPQQNVEWKVGTAALAQGFAPGTQVGVIAWTPNLHCDWAYIAHVEITSEIASGKDFNLFWQMSSAQQLQTLATFRRAGAAAVFAYGKPVGAGAAGWQQLGSTPMWMYKL